MDGLKPVPFKTEADEVLKKAILPFLTENPGLKPVEFIGFFQGAEAPCSLRNANTRVFQ
jgi:hypothetical protein